MSRCHIPHGLHQGKQQAPQAACLMNDHLLPNPSSTLHCLPGRVNALLPPSTALHMCILASPSFPWPWTLPLHCTAQVLQAVSSLGIKGCVIPTFPLGQGKMWKPKEGGVAQRPQLLLQSEQWGQQWLGGILGASLFPCGPHATHGLPVGQSYFKTLPLGSSLCIIATHSINIYCRIPSSSSI